MAEQIGLGAFLVQRRLLSNSEWMEAIIQQIKAQLPIGGIALKAGMLTMRQVQEVLRVSAGSGVRFGEVAVELGYLDMQQIGHLLSLQRKDRPPLTTVLTEMEVIEPDRLKRATEEWRRNTH